MPASRAARRRLLPAALCVLLIMFYLFAGMHILSGEDPLAYKYNSYLLQAQAWLKGEIALSRNYEHLELAVFDGRYYVSFPPVPAVPMLLWTLLFGDDVPGGLIQKIYVMAAGLVVLGEVMRSKRLRELQGVAWSLGICICSAMLPVSLVGGVWYEAQILAFLFSVSAVSLLRRGRITAACLFYALAVGCRPFAAVLGPVLLAMHLENNRSQSAAQALRPLVPGVVLGLCIAAGYAAYNWVRFGDIFEFGHSYLPEFVRSEHGQLSVAYAAQNFAQMLFGPPFTASGGTLAIYPYGFSMFLSCPLLIISAVWLVQDLLKRQMSPAKWTILAMGALNTFLLMMHRTLGGYQFGLRYALELLPLSLCWYLCSPGRRKMRRWEGALLIFGLAFNFIGGCLVHV